MDQRHDFDEALGLDDPVMARDPVEIVNSDPLLVEWKSRRGQASERSVLRGRTDIMISAQTGAVRGSDKKKIQRIRDDWQTNHGF
jgi:hypothetical protein